MFLLENNAEHKYNFADQDTKEKKKNTKKVQSSYKIPSPEFKVTFADSFFNSINSVKESNINSEQLYETQLSKEMIEKYGLYFADSFDKKNVEIPPENFLTRHQFKPSTRRRMVDWMLEVFHAFDSDENTFFAAVRIMDKFIWKSPDIITEKSIFTVGVTSIYIASKTYDFYNIRMQDLIEKVAHKSFDEKVVKRLEKMILTAINFDVMSPGPSEFMQFLLYDLYMNNKGLVAKFRLRKIIDIVENCAIWMAKMCYHFEKYSSKPPNHVALACLFIGFEMAKDNKNLSSNEKLFFVEWLEYLFQNIAKDPETKKSIDNLYQDIYATFVKFKKSGYKNLVKYHELYFE